MAQAKVAPPDRAVPPDESRVKAVPPDRAAVAQGMPRYPPSMPVEKAMPPPDDQADAQAHHRVAHIQEVQDAFPPQYDSSFQRHTARQMLFIGLVFVAFISLVALAVVLVYYPRREREISIDNIPTFNAQDPIELV
jgi:hypothetical protein